MAIVGARRATAYGLDVARALGRGLAAAGVVVVSGMALGVDSAAHAGALEVGGPTIAVLAGGADRAYPASKRAPARGDPAPRAAWSPSCRRASRPHRWSFPARNRIIAALARLTVVVEAAERSGSLITAELARDLGRDVGAVPGRITSPLAAGANAPARRRRGAHRRAGGRARRGLRHRRLAAARARASQVPGHLRGLLTSLAEGRETLDALVGAGHGVGEAMAGLAELELLGHVRAGGGRALRGGGVSLRSRPPCPRAASPPSCPSPAPTRAVARASRPTSRRSRAAACTG